MRAIDALGINYRLHRIEPFTGLFGIDIARQLARDFQIRRLLCHWTLHLVLELYIRKQPPGRIVATNAGNMTKPGSEITRAARGSRVAHLTSEHSAMDSRILYKECCSLRRAGYQVTLVAPHTSDTEVDGVSIRAIRPPPSRWSRISVTLAEIWRMAVKVDADLYHLHDPELLPVGLGLRCRGKAVIYDVHDDFPALARITNYPPLRGPLLRLPSFVLRHLENIAAPFMSAIVAADETLGLRFAARNKKCSIVHNLPLSDEMAPVTPLPWNHRARAIAYIGTFTRWRGLFHMVQAMDLLPSTVDCTLFLVGAMKDHYREQIAKVPGYQRIQVVGPLDRVGVRDILSSVRAGLSVAHPIPFVTLTWPIKIFEYMAAGIPVIASDFPLWRELLGHPPAGLFVDPLDPKSIANAIEMVLGDSSEAERMGKLGRHAVEERYNWFREEQSLLGLYQQLGMRGVSSSSNESQASNIP
jgi:glycosyltransferase involved in cell wall biosynthesis